MIRHTAHCDNPYGCSGMTYAPRGAEPDYVPPDWFAFEVAGHRFGYDTLTCARTGLQVITAALRALNQRATGDAGVRTEGDRRAYLHDYLSQQVREVVTSANVLGIDSETDPDEEEERQRDVEEHERALMTPAYDDAFPGAG
jgi:hypothetical protein